MDKSKNIWHKHKKILTSLITLCGLILILLCIYSSFYVAKHVALHDVQNIRKESQITISTPYNYVVVKENKDDPYYSNDYYDITKSSAEHLKQINYDLRNEYQLPSFSEPVKSLNINKLLHLPLSNDAYHYYQSDFFRNMSDDNLSINHPQTSKYPCYDKYIIDNVDKNCHYHLNTMSAFNSDEASMYDSLKDIKDRYEATDSDNNDYEDPSGPEDDGIDSDDEDDGPQYKPYFIKDASPFQNPDYMEETTTDFSYKTLNMHIAPESHDNMQTRFNIKYYQTINKTYKYNWQEGRWQYAPKSYKSYNYYKRQDIHALQPFLSYWQNNILMLHTQVFHCINSAKTLLETGHNMQGHDYYVVGQASNIVLPTDFPVPKTYKTGPVILLFAAELNKNHTQIKQIGFNIISKYHLYRTGILFDNNMTKQWLAVPNYAKDECYGNQIIKNKDFYKTTPIDKTFKRETDQYINRLY